MKVLKSWINDYIKLDKSNDEIADLLSMSGTAVEEVVHLLDEKIIVVEILEVLPHPNADKLQIAIVSTGDEKLRIVCGAKNINAGQKVPLAQIGTKFADFEIKEAILRGEKSQGMLCSEKELGISDNHEGIMILNEDYEVGKPLNFYIKSDAIFDLEITANRGDCLSHIGIARELSALLNSELKKPEALIKEDGQIALLPIAIQDLEACSKYSARKINNVKVAESPEWLKKRLVLCGAKPINNIVDITNYILLDLGQPLHAFDVKKIEGGIKVRFAEKNEDIVTLDGEIRNLDKDILVIADNKKAVAIAGIMGGKNSEISEDTTDIILESAIFSPKVIRCGSKKLNLSTEASYRFERGIDKDNIEYALDLATKMIIELAGTPNVQVSPVSKEEKKIEEIKIKAEYDKINRLLGTSFTKDEINSYLARLGFDIENEIALVPSWRNDVTIWQDLAEEIARIYGYNHIDRQKVKRTIPEKTSSFYLTEKIKDILVENGFVEVFNYPFLSEEDIKILNLRTEDLLEVINPIQPENKYLKKSLLPHLFKDVAKNPTFDPILIFEIGHIFTESSETTNLALVVSGKGAKSDLEKAISVLVDEFKIKPEFTKITELKRDDLIRYKIKKPIVYFLEIDIDHILKDSPVKAENVKLKTVEKEIVYRSVSKFPSLTRDLAFILDKNIEPKLIIKEIYDISSLINRVELFDEFVSDKFGTNKKNLAFHIYLQAPDRTLNDNEANEVMEDIIRKIEKEYKAKLRAN